LSLTLKCNCRRSNKPEYCGVEDNCGFYPYLIADLEDVEKAIMKVGTDAVRLVGRASSPKPGSVKGNHDENATGEVRANEAA